MRFMFLSGGFIGFVIVALTGFLSDRALDLVLRDAAIGCLAGAFLFRWFWSVWIGAIVHAVQAKRAALAAAEEAAAAAKATPVAAAKTR